MISIIDKNAIINITLILGSLLLGIYVSPFFFLLWFGGQLLDDILFHAFGVSILDPEIRVQRGYQFANVFLPYREEEQGRDLGFNLYDGDLSKTKAQAQIDKWDFMLKELQLMPGDSLIDIGCGYGEWLNYAKSKGIQVVGVNITPEQAAAADQRYGIQVLCSNWKDIDKNPELRQQLYGKFDAVTFMDTIEHYVSSRDRDNISIQNKIYADMFQFAARLLKPNSHSARIFFSCIHRKSTQMGGVREIFSKYFMEKYHSGFYPLGDDGITKNAPPWFVELKRVDRTEDYRITSVLDKGHFGTYKTKLNIRNILHIPLLFLLDPHHIHKWVAKAMDSWMWWHFGEDAWDKSYGDPKQKKNSRVTLWWVTLKRSDPSKAETGSATTA